MKLNKKGSSDAETIIGAIVLIFILFALIKAGIISIIFNVFDEPIFGGYGKLLAILFIITIIAALFGKLLEK